MWQDMVMAICSFGFALALLPQVLKGFRDRAGYLTLPTAGLTAAAVLAISVCRFSLALHYAGVVDGVVGGLWVILLLQRLRYGPAVARGKEGGDE